jgi:linoleoyl-CoA desaturase
MQPTFAAHGSQHARLREIVDEYLRAQDADATERRMLRKVVFILAWFVASYVLLVFFARTAWQAIPLALSLALAAAAVGMNVQHDANHGAFPRGRRLRRALGYTLDLLGGSSYVWRYKHNRDHHRFTNVAGADSDIDLRPYARVAPDHPRRWVHRFQHVYLWALYALLPFSLQFVADYVSVARGRIAANPFPRPRGGALVAFVGGKVLAFALWLGVPLLLHPPLTVLLGFALVSGTLGVVLSVVFQLAHATGLAAFPTPRDDGGLGHGWLEHELRTTANFAQGNRALTWFLGGLNHQVEHHLFPGVPHVHYPALARLLRPACASLGLPYLAHGTFRAAVAAHYRWLRQLGRPAPGPTTAAAGG